MKLDRPERYIPSDIHPRTVSEIVAIPVTRFDGIARVAELNGAVQVLLYKDQLSANGSGIERVLVGRLEAPVAAWNAITSIERMAGGAGEH